MSSTAPELLVAPEQFASSTAEQSASQAVPEQFVPPVQQQQFASQATPEQFVPSASSGPVVPSVVQRAEAQPFVPPVRQQFVPPVQQPFAPQTTPEQFAPPAPQQQFVPPVQQPFVPAAPQQFVPPAPSAPVVTPADGRPVETRAPEPMVVPPAPQQFAPQATPEQFAPAAPSAPVVMPGEVQPVETRATAPVVEQTAPNQPGEAGADGVRLSELTKMIRGMMRSADESAPSPQASQPGADTQSAAPEQVQGAPTADVRRPDPEPELPTVSTMKTASGQEVEVRRPRGQRPQITPRPRPPEANQPTQPAPTTRAPEPQPEGQTWDLDPNKDRSPEAWRQRLIKMALFEREQAARKAGLLPPEAPAAGEQAGQAAQPTAQPQYQGPPQVPVQQVRPAPEAAPVQPTQPVAAQPVPAAPVAQPQPAAQPQQTPAQAAPQQQAQVSATVQRQLASEPASDDRSPQAWSARLFRQPSSNEQTPSGQTPSSGGSPAGPVMPVGSAGSAATIPAPAADTSGDSEGGYEGPQAGDEGYAESAQNSGAEGSEDIPVSARVAMQDSSPTPLPETTRRFLRPLVGIDPADVRIYQGALANQVAAEFNADAVTVGEDVFLAAGNEDVSPSSLGVLAHELTHVARQREAHFVPPTAADQADTTPGEEQLAESVEANVLQRARSIEQQQAQLPPGSAPLLESDSQWGDNEAARSSWAGTPFQPSAPRQPAPEDRSAWGNLPAPWEPLPDWMNTPAQEAGSQGVQSFGLESVFSTTPPAALSTSMSGLNGGAQPSVQLAEVGRSVESNTTEPAASGGGEEQGKAPEPDLDALARQVYALLKQRLAAERRRSEI
ncbi:MAG TPA: DUF4157 domain-containing protein [Roseiflexaceae bacterium]|nr:DUF4157 domain-containing protein [Roseiflexaceae bacterium]